MQITFLGAAQGVTGSCFLVETSSSRFIVDCGMFQGGREAPARNRAPFGFDPRSLDFVLITHAHIDHSGLLPRLGREGYGGPIYATIATSELLEIMLRDSAHIQESSAGPTRGRGVGRRRPSLPLYTTADALAVLEQIQTVRYDEAFSPAQDVRVSCRNAGHILGSALLEIWVTENGRERKLVFSGDLGQPGRPILPDLQRIAQADVLVVESTYGDRDHRSLDATIDELVEVVEDTLHRRGGNVIVPAFAVGRTQEMLYYFHELTRTGRLSKLSIFVDSPMATQVTRLTARHHALFDEEAVRLRAWAALGGDIPYLRFVGTPEESRALSQIRSGAIIISASGMCDAGRVKHHLKTNLPRAECTVMIAGFQAMGTLGRRLVDGAKRVRILGDDIPVRARIATLGGFSAHADRTALLGWLNGFQHAPRRTFIVHGESQVAHQFADHVRDALGWEVTVPEMRQCFDLDALVEGPSP